MPKTDSASLPPLDWSTFAGLHAPQATQVPDELLDWVMAYLTGAELKVVLYIVRRTFGFKKEADAISLDQLCHGIVRRDGRRLDLGTGLKRPTVLEALRSLRAKNLITAVQILDPATGSRPTVYALKLQRGDAPEDSSAAREGGMPGHTRGYARASVDVEGGVCQDIPGAVCQSRPQGYGRADPQQTVRTTNRERQQDRYSNSNASPTVTQRDGHDTDERDTVRSLDDSMCLPLDAQSRADDIVDGLDSPQPGVAHTGARRAREGNQAGPPVVARDVDGESGCAVPLTESAPAMAAVQGHMPVVAGKVAGARPAVAEDASCLSGPHVLPPQDGVMRPRQPIPAALSATMTRLAEDLGDEAPVRSTVTRAYHLMRDAALSIDDFLPLLDQAATRTQAHRRTVTKRRRDDGSVSRKNLAPYFFATLESLLFLRTPHAPQTRMPSTATMLPSVVPTGGESAGAGDHPTWSVVLREMQREMTPENYRRWFLSTRATTCAVDHIEVTVRDALHQHWLDVRLRGRVETALHRLGYGTIQIAFVVEPL